jgi:hypothetical protein
VPGITLYLFGPAQPSSGSAGQTAVTDRNGVYRARVPAGPHYIYTITPFFFFMGLPRNIGSKDAHVNVPENTGLTQDFNIRSSGLSFPLSVRIVGPDDKPVPSATLTVARTVNTIEGPEWDLGAEGPVDADGTFVLGIQQGTAYLHARSGGLSTDTMTVARVYDHVTLRLKPNVLLTLSGQVLDARNRPIAGATVSAHGDAESGMHPGTFSRTSTSYRLPGTTTMTDMQGRFHFSQLYPDGAYSLSVEAFGYGRLTTTPTRYKPGEQAYEVLRPPTADRVVGGRVQDAEGHPLAQVKVSLFGNSKIQNVVTDAQGHFHFDHVVSEALFLIVRREPNDISLNYAVQVGDENLLLVPQFPTHIGATTTK